MPKNKNRIVGPTQPKDRDDVEQILDSEILTRIHKGDSAVLGVVYDKYVNDLYRFGHQFTKDSELVKDTIQEVFINLIKKKKGLRNLVSIKSYLYKSVYNELLNQLKRNRPFMGVDLEQKGFEFELEYSFENRIIITESKQARLEKLQEALKNLTPKQRQVIGHFFYEGFTQQEIAEIIGVKHKNSVAKLIAYAVKQLKQSVLG